MKQQLLQLVVVFFPSVEVEKACPNFSMSQLQFYKEHIRVTIHKFQKLC